jgi:hypothetical protein
VTARVFTAVPGDVREWNRFLRSNFSANEFTGSLQGFAADQDGTVRYTISAGVVALQMPLLSSTSTSVFMFMSGLPAELVPKADQYIACPVIDNGTYQWGLLLIDVHGLMTFYATLAQGAFTASGTKGTINHVMTYRLD